MEQIQGEIRTKAHDILVMEDETSLAKGLRMILEKEGYRVDIASTGHGAMDALRKKEFDLLVADLRLPDMDGMEIIREVREKRPATKAIVITGYPSISSAVDAMKLGVSDYLPKPFWDEDFKAAVEKALAGGKEMYLKQEPDITHARRAVRAERPIRESVKVEPLGRPRVLLMEDEPSLARGLKMVLSKQGYEVDLADTGVRALGSLGMKDFDLLVADLRLPDMDGMEVIRAAKETSPQTQVIVITGYASVPSAVDSMKTGVLDYLAKPFTMDEFIHGEGFCQVIQDAGFHGIDGGRDRSVPGDDDHLGLRACLFRGPDHFHPVHVRKPEIRYQEIEVLHSQRTESPYACVGQVHFVTLLGKNHFKAAGKAGLVLHEENSGPPEGLDLHAFSNRPFRPHRSPGMRNVRLLLQIHLFAAGQRFFHRGLEVFVPERFRQVVRHPQFHGVDRRGDGRVTGDHDRLGCGSFLPDFADDFHPIHVRQPEIRHQEIKLLFS